MEPLAKRLNRKELTAFRGKKQVEVGGHCWQDRGSKDYICARHEYYATQGNNATLEYRSTRTDA
jgi:hypothetical protein